MSGQPIGVCPLAAILVPRVGVGVGGIVGALFAVPLASAVWMFLERGPRSRSAARQAIGPSRSDFTTSAPIRMITAVT